MIFKKKLLVALLCSASFVALSACGGGGGSLHPNNGGNDTPDTPDTPADVFNPTEPAKAVMAEFPAPSASDEPKPTDNAVTVFYYNTEADRAALQEYSLHIWNGKNDGSVALQSVETNSDWNDRSVHPVEVTKYGARFVLPISADENDLNFPPIFSKYQLI